MMTPLRRIKLTKLNQHLVCPLCNGYFVEATTITECLHTFCKTCIVRYLNSSSFCPVCDVQVHKTKPISGLREDKTLQDVVFKLVPDLFHNEMSRRTLFYREHPEAGGDKTEQALKERRHFFHVDDQISLSLEFVTPVHAHAHALGLRPLRAPCLSQPPNKALTPSESKEEGDKSNGLREAEGEGVGTKGEGKTPKKKEKEELKNVRFEEEEKVKIPVRRYLKCPAAVQIRLIEKFIRLKYNLSSHHRVDIVHGGDCLSPELTLLDVVYMYKWTEDDPLQLQYTVIAPPLPLRKRPRSAGVKLKQTTPESSPKKAKLEKETTKNSSKKSKSGPDDLKSKSPNSKSKEEEIIKQPANTSNETEDVKEEIAFDCSNSLNSSRDDADDAMVIDESASDATSTLMDIDTDSSNNIKERESANSSSVNTGKNINNPIAGSSCSTKPVTSSSSGSDNILLVQNSSIESLKALVNNSNYSSFPSKPGQIKTNTTVALNANNGKPSHQSLNLKSTSNQGGSFQTEQHVDSPLSPASISKTTTESFTTTGNTPVTGNSSKPETCNENVSPGTPSAIGKSRSSNVIGKLDQQNSPNKTNSSNANKPVSANTANKSVTPISVSRPNTPCTISMTSATSKSLPQCTSIKSSTSGSPSFSNSNTKILSSKVSNCNSTSVTEKVNNLSSKKSATSELHASAPIVTQVSSLSAVTSANVLATNGTSLVSSKTVNVSRSLVCSSNSKVNQILPSASTAVAGTLPATPAATSLTSVLKTPLASSTTARISSPSQSYPMPPVPDSPVSQKPIQPPSTPRSLISNSYRSSLQMSNGLKMNGIMTAPRPIIDPTKPRLGRPPNSARIAAAAAGRVGPQPILPRGAAPRDIYPQKSAGVTKGEGRGRSKVQNVTGAGRGSLNRLIAPQQPIMAIGKTLPVTRPNQRAQLPQSSGLSQGISKDPQINGIKNLGNNLLNGVAQQMINKDLLTNTKNASELKGSNASELKGNNLSPSLVNAPSGNITKNKKSTQEHTTTSNMQKSFVNSSPKASLANVSSPSNAIRSGTIPGNKATKSPARSKTSNSNASSILSIAQNLANKQLQQQISHSSNDSVFSTGSVTTGSSVLSSATVAAAAAAAASLGPQFNAALGLSNVAPALCAYMAADYNAAMQNLLLTQAAARMAFSQSSLQDSTKKDDSCPMDLSPTSKAPPSTTHALPHQLQKGSKGAGSSKKSPHIPKATSLLSPKSNPSAPPSVPSPKPAQSPSPNSPSAPQTSTISPPTPEVTITKLPNNTISENPSTSTSTSFTTTKPAHTNTVSITKRPSVATSSSNGVTPTSKFAVTRSPSNASVRQIPNPSLLSHQSEVRNHSSAKGNSKHPKQNLTTSVNNNNNSNNNNNNKTVRVDM